MLSQAAAQPPPAGGGAPPQQQGLAAHMGDAFPRSGSSSGLAQPPPTALQLQQELLGGPPSRGPSPATSLTNTPRTLSSGLGGPQGGPPPADLGAPGAGGKSWSSLDGIARPNWQQLAGAPSDGILSAGGQQAALGAGLQRPPSTGPSNPLSSSYGAGGGGLLRGGSGPSPPGSMGLSSQLQQLAAQQQRGGLPSGLPPGPSAAQQQLLQQQLLQQQHLQQQQQLQQQHLQQQQQQQRGAGLPPGGYGQPAPQQQQQQAQSLANLQAAAQAAQAAQAAAMRQQQMLRNALQPQAPAPAQPNLGNLIQHALLQQQQQQQQQAAGNLLQQQNAAALLQQQQNLLNQANALQRAAQQAQQDQLLQGQLNNLALQQQLNINQAAAAAAGMRPGGLAGLNPALAAALLGGGATAQQLQAVQQLQGQQQLAAQQAQQQLLLSQALRANGLQAGLGQRPAAQLQSEALIAMQRQQALQAQGVRVPQGGGMGGTGFTTEQLLQLQQLGLLNKPAPPPAPAAGGSMTAQQQAALLSALQAGSQQQKVAAHLALQQQARPAGPPGLANGAAYLGGQPSAQVRPPAQQLQQANLLAALGGQRPPLPPQAGIARPPSGPGAALASLGGQQGGQQNDPIQTLQDIGKTLAQLNITVEAAVNAGLLGGLSASDVKIVAEAHRAEMEAARSGTPNPQQAAGATPPIPIAPGGGPLSAPGSLGAPTPPAPASPAHSHASAAAAALGAVGGPARSISGAPAASEASGGGASDDDFPLDVEEPAQAKATIDEAALKAKVEQMAAQFDASQYGFFGGAPVAEEEGGVILGELESEGGVTSGPLEGSGEAGDQPARPSSDPGSGAGEGSADRYQLWGGAMLPDELDSKLNLGPAEPGRGSAPPSVAANSPPAGAAGAAGAQPTADIASLWGNAQGDRNDPFGSYLAGLRLGTGF